ncbi:MAG: glucose-1-phosphate adenylyltransferase subunit GlgD [Clostridia bacterium]|nr:glucose-1-phosphate adenylyltransferase subunit GlgD [Clostridia bacterium]
MNALGIIFSDHYSESGLFNSLTAIRTPASLPYAGRYRTIDFTLSAMVNAQITNVGIIAKENYGSLVDHLGSGEDWDLNRRKGGLTMLSPLARPDSHTIAARGRLDALRSIKGYIEDQQQKYVVMAFGGAVANVDLDEMLRFHEQSGSYLTIAYADIPANKGEMTLSIDQDGRINDLAYLPAETEKPCPCSLSIYLMSRKDLLDFLEEAYNKDYTHMNRELVQKNLSNKKICAYHHKEYARIIRTAEDYFAAGMEILEPAVQKGLFPKDRPVYTKVKDSVPTFYGYHAKVENSLIADGCTIKGTVKNSILFRGVTVEEGAVVENAILMQKSKIGADSKVSYVITDKNVTIGANNDLKGTPKAPFVIGKDKEV